MGILRHLRTGKELELSPETVIGRSSRCRVVLHDTRVSSLHAQLRWQGTRWQVLDVSRNGTWVNGRVQRRGEALDLNAGDALCFGRNADPWELLDASEPRPLVIPLSGEAAIPLDGGPVALPTNDAPLVSVFVDPDGEAFLESADHRTLLCDGAEFGVAGHHYRLQLARSEPPTAAIGSRLEEAQLTLLPAQHEEHVGVTLTLGGQTRTLRSRVHFSLLLELARQRLSDQRRGLPTSSEGWVYMDEMCRRLRIDRPTFNTYAHRLRKQFGELELVDAVNIVERRVDSDEVRIGCANLVVE